jgi:hypothetical protein
MRCECGCGHKVKHRFIHGHNRKGVRLSEKQKKKIRGKNNGRWKGDNIKDGALHKRVRQLPKPDSCHRCGIITKKLDLACITRVYNLILSNWTYLCRKCHVYMDKPNQLFKPRIQI